VTPVQPQGAADVLVTHASPREPVWEYILTPSVAMENFAVLAQGICLVGHTHKPAIYRWQCYETLAEGVSDLHQMATVDYAAAEP
jgi:hypothetical protein